MRDILNFSLSKTPPLSHFLGIFYGRIKDIKHDKKADTMADNQAKHPFELTDEEAFYLVTALEVSLSRNRESGEVKMVDIGEGIYARLPETNLTWRDFQ